MENLIHGRTLVYNVNYHIVWSVKYRREILKDNIAYTLKGLLYSIAKDKGFEIKTVEVMPDHVDIFVSAHPKYAPSYISRCLKEYLVENFYCNFQRLRSFCGKVIYGIPLRILRLLAIYLRTLSRGISKIRKSNNY